MLTPDDLAFLNRMERQTAADLLPRLDVKRLFELSGFDDTAAYRGLVAQTTETVRVVPGSILAFIHEARKRG